MTERTSSSCTSNQRAGGLISGYVALVCADVAETVLLSVQGMYDNTKAKKKKTQKRKHKTEKKSLKPKLPWFCSFKLFHLYSSTVD